MSQFDAVVFDVGRVLIDYDYAPFLAVMREYGADIVGEFDFAARIDLASYEDGGIDTAQFFAGLRRMLKTPIEEDTLIAAWTSIFTPIPEMLSLAEELKQHCRVYMLSNISPLHWDYLKREYNLSSYCHDLLGSYEAGALKPFADIYAEAKERFGIEPQRTVFVDDKPENVSGARACGWKGFVHESTEQTSKQLRQSFGLDR
jgi:HAD superfamily hydrolase (TIGR01509 family)